MHIEEAFTAYLLAHAGLTALIGARLYPEEAPQDEDLPAVAYQCISDVKLHSLTEQMGLEQPVYQFTAYAASRASARAVAEQIKAALCDYSGTMSGVTVQYIELQSEISSLVSSSDGTVSTHAVDLEFQIHYNKE